jgi:eukaryotic-like serine/threonine-protein kinase
VGALTRTGEFHGNARFDLRGKLGSGGMGIVYRAVDRERGTEVALKTLVNLSAGGIFRFKQEFRALADVAHANLVTLHELFCEDGRWFFTMELLDGVDLLTYVCGRPVESDSAVESSTLATVDRTVDDRTDREPTVILDPRPRNRPLLARLRQALPQLASGLVALHDAGYIHQDIKPSNVWVTIDGRVVVMDFGVVAPVGEQRLDADGDIVVVGTPAYMAPEQSMAAPLTPASDWYSVGVVLYHVLAGRLPFTGTPERILWDKVHSQPPPPRLAYPDIPEDLDRLCMDLLQPDPAARPSGREVLRRLGAAPERRRPTATPAPPPDDVALVGRDRHLAVLRDAFARTRAGESATVLVHGTSGMGKSTLVRAFLDEVRRDPDAIVLAGRCYERESVPYKAVDTVVDALCQHLLALPPDEVAALLPADAPLLATLFPVLRRIDALDREISPTLAARPHRLRHRAFDALRELLGRIARRRPLIVFVDDMQWGDADSAPLLDLITRPPGAPPLLLLGCYRSDEEHRSSLLAALAGDAGAAERIRLPVGPLEPDQALAVARELFRGGGARDDLAGAVALESGGNPFFLHELVRFAAGDPVGRALPSLELVIGARVDRLGDAARRMIELVAIAARPIEQRVVRAAADITDTDWPGVVQLAAAARLVRVSGRRDADLIECYHDRIRETVGARLAPTALAAHHHALAQALQDSYRRDPEMLARHLEATGDRARAMHYALEAADHAGAALAFDRAAALYRRTLDLDEPAAIALGVPLKLASALVHAGRGAEAARIYLDSAERRDALPVPIAGRPIIRAGDSALELRRLAAEQLLRSGHVDAGLATLRTVLAEVGWKLPGSATRAVPALLWRRLRLRLRGLKPAAPHPIAPEHAALMEVCRTANMGLALFDPVRSAPFATRHLHMALDAGDPFRIAFALAIEAGLLASARNPVRAGVLIDRADAMATEQNNPVLIGCVALIRAVLAHERGDFRECFDICERTEPLLRDHLTGMSWELCTLQMFSLHSLFFLGDFDEAMTRCARYIADARERGDLYAIMNMRALAGACTHMVAHDDPDAARAEIADVERQFPGSGFYVQHMFLLYAKTLVDLYDGQPARAYARLVETHRAVRGSLLLHDRSVRMFWGYLVAGAAAGTAARDPAAAPRLLRIVEKRARALERDGSAAFAAMSHMHRAAAAAIRGKRDAAVDHLTTAIAQFDRSDMKLFAAVARRRIGQLVGGTRGAELVAEADAHLVARRVRVPDRATNCLAPGFP